VQVEGDFLVQLRLADQIHDLFFAEGKVRAKQSRPILPGLPAACAEPFIGAKAEFATTPVTILKHDSRRFRIDLFDHICPIFRIDFFLASQIP
jgi:hypothetical protein